MQRFLSLLLITFVVVGNGKIILESNEWWENGILHKSNPVSSEKINEQKHGPKLEWWENAIFYQIYPRSFKDSNGDGIGDLRGVIQKLDHLKDMGVAGAWLSPIFKSPMADFGYDIADFKQVDPVFGTNADLEELFQKAKALGLKIILDFVPNHSSDQSEWFKKSVKRIEPYTDYYVWHDGKNTSTGRTPPNNWQSIFYGSAWTWNEERQQFYYHNFAKEQPDLNYRNPRVVQEMKDVLRFWLEKGAGGFRIDAINFLYEVEDFRDEPLSGWTDDPNSYAYTHHDYTKDLDEVYDMVYQWRELVDNFQKENKLNDSIVLMTEGYVNKTHFVKYFHSDDRRRQGAQMPFNFVLIESLNAQSTAADFKNRIDEMISVLPEGKRLNWVIGNHDQPRVGSRYGPQKIDGLLMLVMTLPGIAVTYNGEEIGMLDNRDGISYKDTVDPPACNLPETGNWKEASRDPERTPFHWDDSKWAGFTSEGSTRPWLPVHPNYKDINLKLQKEFKRSTYKYYKQLSKLRHDDTFTYGSYNSKVLNDNVLAYTRQYKGHDTYVVLINFGAREETVDVTQLTGDLSDVSQVVVAGADTIYNPGDKLPTKEVFLRKYETVILKSGSSSSASIFSVSGVLLGLIWLRTLL